MKRLLSHFFYAAWLTTVILIVTFAIIFSLARALTPLLAPQRPTVEQWASNILHQPVQIKVLEISWQRLTPVLRGKNVVIFNDQLTRPLLKVQELDIGLDVIGSLLEGRIKLGKIIVDGAHLEIFQNADGTYRFIGIEALATDNKDSATDISEFAEWLLGQSEIILQDLTLKWHSKAGKVLFFQDLNLALRNSGSKHSLAGYAALVQQAPSYFSFAIDAKGDWDQKEKMTARIYFDVKDMQLKQWLGDQAIAGFAVQQGLIDLQLWGRWEDANFTELQTLFVFDDAILIKEGVKQPLVLRQAAGNVLWQRQANDSWRVDANFQNVNLLRWNDIPGVTNLNGYIHLTPIAGSADLQGKNVVADFGPLFRAPLQLNHLSAHANWQQQNNGWSVQVTDLLVTNVAMQVNGDFNLWLPPKGSPEISLLAKFDMNMAGNVGYYLPLTVLKPDLVKWLQDSIIAAQGSGTFILQGALSDFPFDNAIGRFLIDTHIQKGEIRYFPGWPALKEFNGELVFAERSMTVDIASSKMLDIPLQNIHAEIPELSEKVEATLYVNGNVTSTLQAGSRFIQASPLRTKLQNLNDVQLQGPMQLALQLVVPLEKATSPITVKGTVDTVNAVLELPARDMRLQDLQGQLIFTEKVLNAPNLTAKLGDQPIQLQLTTQPTLQVKFHYKDLLGSFTPRKDGWVLGVLNPDTPGEIFIPRNKQQPLIANFKHLYFSSDTAGGLAKWKPTEVPRANITIDELRYDDMRLGRIQMQLEPRADGTRIAGLKIAFPGAQLDATGNWRSTRGGQLTELTGAIAGQDIGGVLRSWGLPGGISSKESHIQFNLQWPGSPYDPTLKQLRGRLELKFTQGQITDIGKSASAKMGLGRLLTALSLQSIGKRLTLDFSDLNAQGFDFDIFKGGFDLRDGNAFIERLSMDGPVAEVVFMGRIGLAAKDYDLHLLITPHFTSSLPVIVGLAGGPIAGAVAWAANKVVGSQVQKIATSTYQMSGPWSNPKVEEVK